MVDKGKGIADDYSSGKRKRDGDDKSGNRSRKNHNVLQFFEDSAFEIEESGSSDDEIFINDDINMYFEDLDAELDVKTEPKTPNIPFFPKEEEMDEEMDKIMEERYKPGSNYVKYAEDRTQSTRFEERNTSMPFAKDPTIWKVKCMVGRERHSAFCLMQKFVDLQSLGTKLRIVSVSAVDHVKGFIYIEAEKQADINEACKGLCNIFPTRVAAIPVSEVPHLFAVRSKCSGISVNTWARVKMGKYKGDLAQVVHVNEAKRKVTVKLVPRIDLQAVAEKFGGGVKSKKSTVPAPRLITSSELEPYRPLVQHRRDKETGDMYEFFDGMTLKDGFLYKKVPLDSLSFWDVRPTESEAIKFIPANKEESNDVEWLTGLFGERKKKKPTVTNNTGGKGEGSSSSPMENGLDIPDLVFHGRNAFGIVIGREKDDLIKVLGEGSDKPVVVALEARLLKKADFDKKFTAFDQHKKIISTNDCVRILEGPLEDKRGIVKQIYKGVVFFHDENETENSGYYCAKAQICEKMDFSSDFSKGKGGKSDASGFGDFPTSPKSPLSPNKPFEVRESSRNFDQEEKEGLSVGQACRIRVGPLKGYICRVMAIRYSDIMVKLDSQHKILTVKAEHLAEVKEKSSAVPPGDGQDSTKPFELLGENGSSQGWLEGGSAAPESGGWNTGGQSSERSSWAPFSAAGSSANPFGSADNDASKDVGGSAWGAKTTQDQNTQWGAASASEKPSGGWGASSSGANNNNSNDAGWGSVGGSNDGEKKSAWGSTATASAAETGGWGAAKKDEDTTAGGGGSSWGKPAEQSQSSDSGWGKKPASDDGGAGGWGTKPASNDGGAGGWGNKPASNDGGSGGWGAKSASNDGGSGGWGAKPASNDGGSSGWGTKQASDDGGAGGWGKKPSVTGGDSESGGGGWGKPSGGGGASWSKPEGGSGGGGGNACFKCGEEGHMSRECPKGGGGGGGRNCYKCGEEGHMSRECPKGGGGGGNACFKCGEEGHMSRECPKGGGGGGDRSCYKCGESGHMSRECPKGGGGGGNACFKCGESGHMSRECPQGGSGGGGRSCYKCGESGHMSRECPQGGGGGGGGGGGRSCYKCGEEGHMSRECPKGGSGGGGDRSCYKCGESGHMSRECPQGGGGGGGRNCYKCGESGHMSRECPQGGGGGGGGGGRNCFKCGESGHMSRECPQGGGGGGGGSRNCFKCGESGHMSRECPQGGGGGGGGGSYGGGGGGAWSSGGGWGSNKGSDAGGGGGGWSSGGGGGWGSTKASDADAPKKDDAQGNQWGGSGGGGQTGGWGSDGGKKADAQGSGWGSGSDQTEAAGKKEGWSSGGQTSGGGGWGSSKDSGAADAKKDDAEGSGWKKSGW